MFQNLLFSVIISGILAELKISPGIQCKSPIRCLSETTFTFCFIIDGSVVLSPDVYTCPDNYFCIEDEFNPCERYESKALDLSESRIGQESNAITTSDEITTITPQVTTMRENAITEEITTENVLTEEIITENTTTEEVTMENTTTEEVTTENTTTEEITTENTTENTTTEGTSTENTTTKEIATKNATTEEITTENATTENFEKLSTTTIMTTKVTIPSTTESPVTPPKFCIGPDKYPAKSCNEYYECIEVIWWRELVLKPCPNHQVFNAHIHKCVPTAEYNCTN